jgi:hypothetical protein
MSSLVVEGPIGGFEHITFLESQGPRQGLYHQAIAHAIKQRFK